MNRKRHPSSFSIAEKERNRKSAMVFMGRILLVGFYQSNGLTTAYEDQNGIDIPDKELLMLLPEFMERGLDAASDYLTFTSAGINIGINEAGYGHQSREKLALLCFIIFFEIGRDIQISKILKDELIRIKRMSELVDWISNLKTDKNVYRFLETKQQDYIIPQPLPLQAAIPSEKSLTIKELAAELGISDKTIRRNPNQFKPHHLGVRKFYYLSECKPKYNK